MTYDYSTMPLMIKETANHDYPNTPKLLDQMRIVMRRQHHAFRTASTQNQALSAILFLYKQVIAKPLSAKIKAVRAKSAQHLPTVLSQNETRTLLKALLPPMPQLVARLL